MRVRCARTGAADRGAATAEYAAGCVAAGFGFCLFEVLTDNRVYQLLDRLVREGWVVVQRGVAG